MKNFDKFKTDLVNAIFLAYDNGKIEYNKSNRNYEDVTIKYFTLLLRLIGPKKRKVHISKEIQEKIKGNDAESQRLKTLVENMKEKFEQGKDVNGHLSKTVFSIKDGNEDMLFNDWRIYHLHMDLKELDIFNFDRKMSGDLLFVVVLYDDVYFLQITYHDSDDWYKFEYLQIMKNNWENELLFKHNNIVDISCDFSSTSEIKKIRKANLNNIIHFIGGDYYSVKSLGYSTTGTNIEALFMFINLNKMLEKLDFKYSKLSFAEYCIGSIGDIIDEDGNKLSIVYATNK